ncbi:MAG: site-specific DNA-methyltransferase [Candidatus Heimdallarchaeota archaeon]|nr:site-specific DNA-methyltransferase [Candidatus Heimdallarchaeota archaeon]
MQQLPKESIDLVIADPPFGIDFSGKEEMYNRKDENIVEGYVEISQEEYEPFTHAWIAELPRIMKRTASAYIISGWTNLEFILTAARKAGLTLLNHAIWQYQFGVFTWKKFVTSHYHVLLFVKDPDHYFFNKIEHYPLDVWDDIQREYQPKEKKNGTKLPTKLIQKCIDFSTKPGAIVLDPFMGNGTTAAAAKANFRHYLGFEINPNLKTIIEENLAEIELGEDYQSYNRRFKKWLKENEKRLAKKYPKAYKIWQSNKTNGK